jgi:hypothetical protein
VKIFSTRANVQKNAAKPPAVKAEDSNPNPKDSFQTSEYSGKRDLAYTSLAVLSQAAVPISNTLGGAYGIPQVLTGVTGGLMTAAGVREMMVNKTARGRLGGGLHAFAGLATALTPLAGDYSTLLFGGSLLALGLNATINQPGNIVTTTVKEIGGMTGEVFSNWDVDTKDAK